MNLFFLQTKFTWFFLRALTISFLSLTFLASSHAQTTSFQLLVIALAGPTCPVISTDNIDQCSDLPSEQILLLEHYDSKTKEWSAIDLEIQTPFSELQGPLPKGVFRTNAGGYAYLRVFTNGIHRIRSYNEVACLSIDGCPEIGGVTEVSFGIGHKRVQSTGLIPVYIPVDTGIR